MSSSSEAPFLSKSFKILVVAFFAINAEVPAATDRVFPSWMSLGFEVEIKEEGVGDFSPGEYPILERESTIEGLTRNHEWNSRPTFGDGKTVFQTMNDIKASSVGPYLSNFHLHARVPKEKILSKMTRQQFEGWVRGLGEYLYYLRFKILDPKKVMASVSVGRLGERLSDSAVVRLEELVTEFDLEFKGTVKEITLLEQFTWSFVDLIERFEQIHPRYLSVWKEIMTLYRNSYDFETVFREVKDVYPGIADLTEKEAAYMKWHFATQDLPQFQRFDQLETLSINARARFKKSRIEWAKNLLEELRKNPDWTRAPDTDQIYIQSMLKWMEENQITQFATENLFTLTRHSPVSCSYTIKALPY